ncbi:hypothetical protein OJ997_17395 [Solirubrobacter phytolaccae]|uniref:Uncharacterized protein n=1 Tax=Solirubrobacter phytolaccae TaxID=1404360 RepID=A0A9X3N9Q5_9ACTN|nr:hypothetical protein [Solirubrobacter phytolaccae]MDA0182084.1 hypothetical protein [Solirubrobacter phytolaccae]
MAVALRIAGLVAVVGAVALIDGSTATWVAVLAFTLVVGALIARWWALLAPIGIAAVAFVVERDETEVGVGTITLVFGIVLVLGIGLGKLARLARPGEPKVGTPAR